MEALGCVRLAHCVKIMCWFSKVGIMVDQLLVVRRFCKPQHGDGFMRAYCVVQRGTMHV